MTALSPLDGLLATLDKHINSNTAASEPSADAPRGGLAALNLRRQELRGLIAGPSASNDGASSSALQLSPLERAIYYETDSRRSTLQRKAKELDFWEAYENELADSPMKMPTSASALERQIAEKKSRLRQLEGENRLKVETTRALESSATIQKVLSTTSPRPRDRKGDEEAQSYASTRELLNKRDDQALEFLKVFNEIRTIKNQRVQVKKRIREQRLETMKLLENIKGVKADIRNRQLHPAGGQQDPDASQDLAIVQRVQQMQREINEARSKKELVKGILRGLILESGRDWTKNPSTRALMLSLDDEEDASDDAFSEEEEEGNGEAGDDDEDEENEEDEEGIDQLEDA
ncbi:Centromere protein H [Kalmanozyma brasiliensis GHG001]|uniref:Centromere protein H C-terminal domain-containing protein n=1 Tax=Kalmanozyma brasiliensis (strain GHG001) TaxID=1365824 RepID=V5EX88_KALBG|nr:Centromere protein H [Kalmanozyma brasiliensis GHG001]EST08038.1 Centromere protein H [Kalmanozyma brasiliensis GHG001]